MIKWPNYMLLCHMQPIACHNLQETMSLGDTVMENFDSKDFNLNWFGVQSWSRTAP